MINSRSGISVCSIILSLVVTNFYSGYAQTKNPDISVATDFRTLMHDDNSRSSTKGKFNLDLVEMELAIQGYLNPYARADIFIAKHGTEEGVEIEEAYATFLRGLPFGLNIKAGKYLVDFGKLNTLHPHAYSFVQQPLMFDYYFGTDGLNDVAINLNLLLPTGDVYSNLSFNILKGNYVKPHTHDTGDEPQHEEEIDEFQPLGFSSRLSAHIQVGEYSNLEFGLSGLTGIHDIEHDLRHSLGGLDIKYKWRPNRYKSLTIHTEAILNHRNFVDLEHTEEEIPPFETESVTAFGCFAFLDYQFKQRWNVGIMSEFGQNSDQIKQEFWSQSLFAGFAPMEETTVIRLLLKRENPPYIKAFNTVVLQLIFSLGPHKPHKF